MVTEELTHVNKAHIKIKLVIWIHAFERSRMNYLINKL